MEGPIGQEHKQHEFALLSVSELSLSCSESPSKPVIARFSVDSGVAELRLHKESESIAAWNVDLQAARVSFNAFRVLFFFCFVIVWLSRKVEGKKVDEFYLHY